MISYYIGVRFHSHPLRTKTSTRSHMIGTSVGRLKVKLPKPSERESLFPESDLRNVHVQLEMPCKVLP